MRKLTYYVAVTIDGYIADPEGGYGFFPIEGPHMDYLNQRLPETIPGHVRKLVGIDAPNRRFDTVVMGRGTYEPALAIDITDPYPHLRTVVFSKTIRERLDPKVEITDGDPLARVRELKREEGMDIWLCGGGKLASELRAEIDELLIKRYPIVAGGGKPIFAGEFGPQCFMLTDHHTFDNGVAFMTYHRQ
ncbi:MAG TPA: dihydrofolate reductase family protein [Thermomicrobiales bacterium]|nr:dihydrofolate reductase family protein [Thermomicrobiales bacterium]